MILKQHERQRESTLAAQFDLTSSEIKDCACKEGSQGTFFAGDQNFSHYVTEEENSAGATLANPNGKASNCISHSKLMEKTTKSIRGLNFCAHTKLYKMYCCKKRENLELVVPQTQECSSFCIAYKVLIFK